MFSPTILLDLVPWVIKYRNWIFGIIVVLLLVLGIYNQGVRDERAVWVERDARTAAKIAQDIADNKILAAVIKGENYVWKNALDTEFANANLMSAGFDFGFGESSTANGTNATPQGSGISPERIRIAEERKRIVKEITGIRQTRNYLAREAKSNTKTLIDLQRFNSESK